MHRVAEASGPVRVDPGGSVRKLAFLFRIKEAPWNALEFRPFTGLSTSASLV